VLRHVPVIDDPRVLVDAATRDDAAVFQISADRALVATVDFFTPIVDDPYSFGAIAAANALSDLYAMGARPLFALNLVAWPRGPELLTLLGDTLRGGMDVARRAGLLVLGGHTIEDPEPKYGLVAIGEVSPARIVTNAGACVGDRLVLTKPIGTGILSTALKRDLIAERDMTGAITSMTTLNADAMDAMRIAEDGVHACTDVTGFGLLGHLHTVLLASGRAARLDASAVPLFPRVRELGAQGALPGGTVRNRKDADGFTAWSPALDDDTRTVLCDAQTSGGLLIAVAPAALGQLVRALEERGTLAAVIGELREGPAGTVEVG
jgi:selenide,water dikinase